MTLVAEAGTTIEGTVLRPGSRLPSLAWYVAAVGVLLFWAYGLVFPQYRAPDEPQHVDLTLAVSDGVEFPEFDDAFITDRMNASLDLVRFRERSRSLIEAEATERAARPTFEMLGTLEPTAQPNTLAAHPPLYYWLMGGAASAAADLGGAGWAWDEEAALLRVLNGLLAALTALVVYRAAEAFGLGLSGRLAAMIIVLAIPRLAEIGGAVNNDNLLMLFASIVVLTLIRIGRGDLSWPTTLVGGVALGLALLTKGFALVLPVVVVAVFVPLLRSPIRLNTGSDAGQDIGGRSAAWWRLAGFGAASLVAGGWWWFRNVAVHGALQPARRMLPTAVGFDADPGAWLDRFFRVGNWKFWGVFGWFDVSMPVLVTVAATVVLVVPIVAAVSRGELRWLTLSLLSFPVLLLVVVGQNAWRSYARTGGFAFIQGRYLYSAVAVLAVVAAAGALRLAGNRRGWVPVALWAFGTLLHLWAMVTVIPFYWAEPGAGPVEQMSAMVAWAAWPAPVTVGVLVSAFAAWLLLGLALIRRASRLPAG